MDEIDDLLRLAPAFAPADSDARHAYALVLRVFEERWWSVDGLDKLLAVARKDSFGGLGAQEFLIEPEWGEHETTRVEVSFLSDRITCEASSCSARSSNSAPR
jgi:hypothetical protein